jgi:hypothetical protein
MKSGSKEIIYNLVIWEYERNGHARYRTVAGRARYRTVLGGSNNWHLSCVSPEANFDACLAELRA